MRPHSDSLSMWALGVLMAVIGYGCIRLGRFLGRNTLESNPQAFAASILIRIVGAGLIVVGTLRVVGVL